MQQPQIRTFQPATASASSGSGYRPLPPIQRHQVDMYGGQSQPQQPDHWLAMDAPSPSALPPRPPGANVSWSNAGGGGTNRSTTSSNASSVSFAGSVVSGTSVTTSVSSRTSTGTNKQQQQQQQSPVEKRSSMKAKSHQSDTSSQLASEAEEDVKVKPEVLAWIQKHGRPGGAVASSALSTASSSYPGSLYNFSHRGAHSLSTASIMNDMGSRRQGGYSGNEAVVYMREHSFSVTLDVPVRWPSRNTMQDAVSVVIPGAVLEQMALQYSHVLFADQLSQRKIFCPPMSAMCRWFPYRVSLVRSYSSNVTGAWGLRWENPVMYRHCNKKWGVCAADYDKDRKEDWEDPEMRQQLLLWASTRHGLFEDFQPETPLVLSDMSAYMDTNVFRLTYIDADTEYAKSVQPGKVHTNYDQQEETFYRVKEESQVGMILRDYIPEFSEVMRQHPPELDGWYPEVPKSLCERALVRMHLMVRSYVGYRGFKEDQVFLFVPLPADPPGLVSQSEGFDTLGSAVRQSMNTRPSSKDAMGRYTFQDSEQERTNYVIPCRDYDQAARYGDMPAEIIVTLKLDICPAMPLSDEEGALLGNISVANINK